MRTLTKIEVDDEELQLIKAHRKIKDCEREAENKKNIAAFRELYPSSEYILSAVPDAVSKVFEEHGMSIVSAKPEDMDTPADWSIKFKLENCSNSNNHFIDYFGDSFWFWLYGVKGEVRRVENVSDWVSTLRECLESFIECESPDDSCDDYRGMSLSRAMEKYAEAMSEFNSTVVFIQEIITQLEESLDQGGA